MPQTSTKRSPKVRCRSCATLNPSSRDTCRACGATLKGIISNGRRRWILAGGLAKPLARRLSRPLHAVSDVPIAEKIKQPLKRAKESSRDVLSADLEMLEDFWQSMTRQIGVFAPNLPQAIERLAQLESHLVEITGLDSPAFGKQRAPINEELRWLRDRLQQTANDAESMLRIRHTRDVNQVLDSLTAAMRFTIAAIGIVRLSLDMVDRLRPKRVITRAFRGEAP